jgi:hydroxymethylpyrimidine/phosphomethylpyrimidine kinase
MAQEEVRDEVLEELKEAVRILQKCKQCSFLMPEVRMNLVYALPNPKTINDVAAIDGRITVVKGGLKPAGDAVFGASDHMARLMIEIARYNPKIRAGINFKYDDKILTYINQCCTKKKCKLGRIDRTKEPASVKEEDGMSIPWKVKTLVENNEEKVPTIFYESEGWGKEPLFVLVGEDPVSVVEQLLEITNGYLKSCKS